VLKPFYRTAIWEYWVKVRYILIVAMNRSKVDHSVQLGGIDYEVALLYFIREPNKGAGINWNCSSFLLRVGDRNGLLKCVSVGG
jgi:hypothetical protein